MQAGINERYPKINELLRKIHHKIPKEDKLGYAIELSNEILIILGADKTKLLYGEDALDRAFSNSKFRNQKMETWFVKHPYLRGARTVLSLVKEQDEVYDSNFFWLNESATKARISASVMLSPNWEDSELTMLPNYKVGVDFFLNNEGNSLLIAVSNKGNLRVIELNERLSNTQIEILNSIKGCFLFDGIDAQTGIKPENEPQRTIHRKLWEALELKEVNKKFYIGISDHFEQLCQHLEKKTRLLFIEDISKKNLQNFANRLIGRILFIWFLRKRNIIDESQNYFEINLMDSTEYYNQKLKILFFETLNLPIKERKSQDIITPYLNGGLFEAHKDDLTNLDFDFPKGWFDSLYKHLNEFNFTTDESTPEYEQIAIDPEMLGRVFENLLASILPETTKAANEKKNKGAFYTPREIVDFMCKASLKQYLINHVDNEKDNLGIERLIEMNDSDFMEQKSTGTSDLWGTRSELVKNLLIDTINNIKILDPACGSGAFPIGMLQLLVKTLERLNAVYDTNLKKFRLTKANEKIDIYNTKLAIIKHSLYGSDIEPMAVEISRLRSWLSLIINDKSSVDPLPNLDFNFVCSNSLIPLETTYQTSIFDDNDYEETLKRMRENFFDAHGIKEKLNLKQDFRRAYTKEINDNNSHKKVQQLKTWNPFEANSPALFFDSKVMFDVNEFDVVIGNPPYIHFESIKDESKSIYKPLGYKTYEARGDMYTLFYEMAINNLKKNGILTYITSNKWMRTSYGESLRDFFIDHIQPILLIDLGSGVFDSATVDTNILVAIKTLSNKPFPTVQLNKSTRKSSFNQIIKENATTMKFNKGLPWVILTFEEAKIKEKIEKNGKAIDKWSGVRINYGIKTGLNEAFIIDEETKNSILKECKTEEERKQTLALMRPFLRGKDIQRYQYEWAGLYLINTHNGYMLVNGKKVNRISIDDLYSLKMYFDSFGHKLETRTDQGDKPYNLRNCAYMADFDKTKILYSETNSSLETKIALDDKQYLTDKTCFILVGNNDIETKAIYNIMSSKIFTWYMSKVSPLLGESGISLTKDSVSKFPLPINLDIKTGYNFTNEEMRLIENITK
jgi:type I restriction-modification system DNA methylase subunit